MTQIFILPTQNGDEIRAEGECEVCTCEDYGEMTCVEMTCPELNCVEDELISYREGVCCPYCLSDWVEVYINRQQVFLVLYYILFRN